MHKASYDHENEIYYERQDPKTLKTLVYSTHDGDIERVIDAAIKISDDLYELKYFQFKGPSAGCIDTVVTINYNDIVFCVDHKTKIKDALRTYRLAHNDKKPNNAKLRIVS